VVLRGIGLAGAPEVLFSAAGLTNSVDAWIKWHVMVLIITVKQDKSNAGADS
jgi:hypothetical protein